MVEERAIFSAPLRVGNLIKSDRTVVIGSQARLLQFCFKILLKTTAGNLFSTKVTLQPFHSVSKLPLTKIYCITGIDRNTG